MSTQLPLGAEAVGSSTTPELPSSIMRGSSHRHRRSSDTSAHVEPVVVHFAPPPQPPRDRSRTGSVDSSSGQGPSDGTDSSAGRSGSFRHSDSATTEAGLSGAVERAEENVQARCVCERV